MGRRLDLQQMLESIPGVNKAYYQKPSNVNMEYPAIIYEIEGIDNSFADNENYMQKRKYQVMVVDSNPDSEIVDTVSKLQKCRFNRHYKADNLNHYVFTLEY